MPCLWIACPVVTNVENGERRPLVSTFADFLGGGYDWSGVVATTRDDVCLVRVCGLDLTPINNSPDCVDLIEQTFEPSDREVFLDQTTKSDGQFDRVVAKLAEKSVDTKGLTRASTYREILTSLGKTIDQSFAPDLIGTAPRPVAVDDNAFTDAVET